MNITNIMLMFVVVVIVFITIAHMIKKNKNEIVDSKVDVDASDRMS